MFHILGNGTMEQKATYRNKEWNINGTKFLKLFIYKWLGIKKVEQKWNKGVKSCFLAHSSVEQNSIYETKDETCRKQTH